MSALITLAFQKCNASTNLILVDLQQAHLILLGNNVTEIAISSGITNLSVSQSGVQIATSPGAAFEGSIGLQLSWQDSETPIITVDNVTTVDPALASVTWPTAEGPITARLTTGTPMYLTNIIADPSNS